jgi:hypothetical protein
LKVERAKRAVPYDSKGNLIQGEKAAHFDQENSQERKGMRNHFREERRSTERKRPPLRLSRSRSVEIRAVRKDSQATG